MAKVVKEDRGVDVDISVIIPTVHHVAEFGRLLIDLARQTYRRFEVIVVDNGSTMDEVTAKAELLGELGVASSLIVVDHRLGPSGARNVGLRHARAEWIVYLDDDDVEVVDWGYLRKVSERDSTVDLLFSSYLRDQRRCIVTSVTDVVDHGMFATVTFSHRRSLVDQLGGWDETFPRMNDDELVARYVAGGARCGVVDAVAVRIHERVDLGRVTYAYPSLPFVTRIIERFPKTSRLTGRCAVMVTNELTARLVATAEYRPQEFMPIDVFVNEVPQLSDFTHVALLVDGGRLPALLHRFAVNGDVVDGDDMLLSLTHPDVVRRIIDWRKRHA